MQRSRIVAIVAATLAAFAFAGLADAKLGGGRSLGAQRPSVAPRASAPPAATPPAAASQPVMPAQPGATLPAKPAAPAAPAPSGASRWLGPIAGLAAGLGIAALLSHFGLPEGLGSFLLIALLVVGAVVLVRMVLARRNDSARPLAYAGTPAATPSRSASGAFEAPQWGGAARIEPVLGPTSDAPAATARPLPPGFDAVAFADHARRQFLQLQAAHDAGDRKSLAAVLTPEMLTEIVRDLDASGPRGVTEFVTLQANVLEVVTEGDRHWASIRFSGTLREPGAAATSAFDEVWNLTKPNDGSSGWLLAGIQQYAEAA